MSLSLSSLSLSLSLSLSDIAAYPESVNVLEGISDDARTPDKLVDNINDSEETSHMWLSPVLPGALNTVYIVFNRPQCVGSIRLWNYGKTPTRGAREIAVCVNTHSITIHYIIHVLLC